MEQFKWDGIDVSSSYVKYKRLLVDAKGLGISMDEDTKIWQFLRNVPRCYTSISMSLRGCMNMTLEDVVLTLRRCQDEQPSTENKQEVGEALMTQNIRNVKCYYCNKMGHISRNCRAPRKVRRSRNEVPSPSTGFAGNAMVSTEHNRSYAEVLFDSGASNHMVSNKQNLSEYTSVNNFTISTAEGACMVVKGVGVWSLPCGFRLANTLHVPDLVKNLISISVLDPFGQATNFANDKCVVTNKQNEIMLYGIRSNELYKIKLHANAYFATEHEDTDNNEQSDQNEESCRMTDAQQTEPTKHNDTINTIRENKYLSVNTDANEINKTQSNEPTQYNNHTENNESTENDIIEMSSTVEMTKQPYVRSNTIHTSTEVPKIKEQNLSMQKREMNNTELWHARLGHLNITQLINLQHHEQRLKNVQASDFGNCDTCSMSKITRKPIRRKSQTIPAHYVKCEFVDSDLLGPILPHSSHNKSYLLSYVDHATRYVWVAAIEKKSDQPSVFEELVNKISTQHHTKLRVLRSDNGGEYKNTEMNQICRKHGIHRQFTHPYASDENPISERWNRTTAATIRCLLAQNGLSDHYWDEVAYTATYLRNRSIVSTLGISPFEALYEVKPDLKNLRAIGCLVYYKDNQPVIKLSPRDKRSVLLGYSRTNTQGYRLLDLNTRKVLTSRNVILEATIFPLTHSSIPPVPSEFRYHNGMSVQPSTSSPVSDKFAPNATSVHVEDKIFNQKHVEDTFPYEEHVEEGLTNEEHSEVHKSKHGLEDTVNSNTPPEANYRLLDQRNLQRASQPLILRRSTRTRTPNTKYINKQLNYAMLSMDADNPNSYIEAMMSVNSNEWHKAMHQEMSSLIENNTCKLVPPDQANNVIDNRWVYQTKYKSNGELERYKARLTAQGFSQIHGVDFHEVFAPTCNLESIRIILAIASNRSWPVHQSDVVTVFLNSNLPSNITVHMRQPPGFILKGKENHVLRLNKAIYGLKQASREWNLEVTRFW